MTDDTRILTNTAAATRLRALLHQLTREPSAPGTHLVRNLTPTPEEQLLLSGRHEIPLETP